MMRLGCAVALLVALMIGGCSSTPQLETRSYQLQRRTTEEPLIMAVLSDESARTSVRATAEAVKRNGGRIKQIEVTPDNTAIVRTTRRGHNDIRDALEHARKEAATTQPVR